MYSAPPTVGPCSFRDVRYLDGQAGQAQPTRRSPVRRPNACPAAVRSTRSSIATELRDPGWLTRARAGGTTNACRPRAQTTGTTRAGRPARRRVARPTRTDRGHRGPARPRARDRVRTIRARTLRVGIRSVRRAKARASGARALRGLPALAVRRDPARSRSAIARQRRPAPCSSRASRLGRASPLRAGHPAPATEPRRSTLFAGFPPRTRPFSARVMHQVESRRLSCVLVPGPSMVAAVLGGPFPMQRVRFLDGWDGRAVAGRNPPTRWPSAGWARN